MKVAVIINGVSRRKKFFFQEILPPLREKFDVTVTETQFAQHAIELAAVAAREGFDYVLAAGGDGTLNQVLNGVLTNLPGTTLPAVGIIPLGTGNDFARMCAIKPDGNQIAHLIEQNSPKLTDMGRIACNNEVGKKITKYFVNVCSIGMGPEVVKRLMKSDRSLGPLLTYLKAITETFFTHRPQEVDIKTDIKTQIWQWRGKVRVLAIANGRSFGNQMYIAPDAHADDGVFSTFIAGDLSLLNFLWCLQQIKGGKKIRDKQIFYNQCTSIDVTAPGPSAIEAEGEWMGWLPMRVDVLPKAINFLR